MLRSFISAFLLIITLAMYAQAPEDLCATECDIGTVCQAIASERASEANKTVCLNMIVKNESDVIQRCLNSVKPAIDYWVIVDTGSQDNTKELIQECLKDIPGELHERTWKNFGDNRSEAFELAKGKSDYILFMDADDVLEFDAEPTWPTLTSDLYNMWRGTKGFTYTKPQLVKADLPWKWVGVTHEYLGCDQIYSSDLLKNVRYLTLGGGADAKHPKEKFLKNVKLLEEGLKNEPENERYAFYLAESYRDSGEKGKALECYQKRVKMGGWEEEVFWSLLQIAHMMRDIGVAPKIVIESYKEAHKFRPHRVEPIYFIAEMSNQQGDYSQAYEYLKTEPFIPKPAQKDSLFNMDWIKEYGLLFQLSICSYYVGQYEECLKTCDTLLQNLDLPESWRKQTELNRSFPIAKMQKKETLLITQKE